MKIDLTAKLAQVLYNEHLEQLEAEREIKTRRRDLEHAEKVVRNKKEHGERTDRAFFASLSKEDREKLIDQYNSKAATCPSGIQWIFKNHGLDCTHYSNELNPCNLTVTNVTGVVDEITDLLYTIALSRMDVSRFSLSFCPYAFYSLSRGWGNSSNTLEVSVNKDSRMIFDIGEDSGKQTLREFVVKALRFREDYLQKEKEKEEKRKGR